METLKPWATVIQMDDRGDLGTFLKQRRAGRSPDAAGIWALDRPRRVPGLRREELAHLAGVSPSYLARLEQGQSQRASPEVLGALAAALGLDADERAHLKDLAATTRMPRRPSQPPSERADAQVLDLLRVLDGVPAFLTGRRGDVLAWNDLGHRLLFGHLGPGAPAEPHERPNVARQLFLDPHAGALFVDWNDKARDLVAHLRLISGRFPEDALLAELVGELAVRSPAFARLWADHRVRPCSTSSYRLTHQVIGAVAVTQQTLAPTGSPDQALVTITCQPGSRSAAAILRLRPRA